MKTRIWILILTVLCLFVGCEKPEEPPLYDLPLMVHLDGKLYTATGETHTEAKCGVMDGELSSTVPGYEIPTEDGTANFGENPSYQYGADGTIEIFMGGEWWIFAAEETEEADETHETSPESASNDSRIPVFKGKVWQNTVTGIGKGAYKELMELSDEDAAVICAILENAAWQEGETKCIHDVSLNLDGTFYSYHSACGTFGYTPLTAEATYLSHVEPGVAERSVVLSEEDTRQVNAVLEKYITGLEAH